MNFQEIPHADHLSIMPFQSTFLKLCVKALEPALKLDPLSHHIWWVALPVLLKKRKNALRNELHDISKDRSMCTARVEKHTEIQHYLFNLFIKSVTKNGLNISHPVVKKAHSPETSLSLGKAAMNWVLNSGLRSWKNTQFLRYLRTADCPCKIQKRFWILANT